ncbi:MAG: tetratricopeptide repeat protein, partial [Chitinophagales bacterium]
MSKQRELELAGKYFKEGEQLNKQEKYDASNTALKKANEIYQKWKEWERWIETNDCIDRNYVFLNKLNEAINYWQSTVKTGRKYLGEEHLEVARRLHCIGVCHYFAGDYDPAIEYYKKALFIRRKILGNEHKDVGSSNNNLGICYYSKDNYDLAIEHHQKTLEIWKKSLGAEHSFIASSLNNSGVCYEAKGDYDLAIRYHKEALSIRKKNLGNEHLKVAMSLNNIGVCYDFKGNYDLAIEYHQKALAIRKKNLNIENTNLFLSFMNLGTCHEFKGNYDLAIEYHQEALRIRKKYLGEQHPDVADDLTNLGNCHYKKGDYDLATKYHQEALSTWQKGLGKEHPRIAISLKNLGDCYKVKGDYTLALSYHQEALTTLIPSFHPTNVFQNPSIDTYSSGYELLSALENKTQTFLDSYTLQSQKTKEFQAALSTIKLATSLITNIRQSYKAQGSKHTLSEKAAKTYNLAIKIALKTAKIYNQLPSILQYPELTNIPYTVQDTKKLAFNFTEQSKAILLLSSFKDSEAKTNANIPKDLLEKEKQLKIELNYLDKSIATQEAKGDQKDEELLSKFQSQYFDYKQQYDQLITQFETDYPEYYRLKYDVKTALVEEIQAYLSKSNEPITNHQSTIQLISYHITPKTIYIFTITSNDYQIHTIEKPSNFSELLEDFQTAFTLADVEEYMNTAGVLFDLLLKPVLDSITTGSRKLIIIPHEQLSTLSFDA